MLVSCVQEYTFCQPRDFADGPRCCSGVEDDPDASNVCSEGTVIQLRPELLESVVQQTISPSLKVETIDVLESSVHESVLRTRNIFYRAFSLCWEDSPYTTGIRQGCSVRKRPGPCEDISLSYVECATRGKFCRYRYPAHETQSPRCRLPLTSAPCPKLCTLVIEDSICDKPEGLTRAELAGVWIGIVTGVISIAVAVWKGCQWCKGKPSRE